MTLYRARDFIDAYRVRSMSPDINDLSGRDGRSDITLHVSNMLAEELNILPQEVIADIGCGDGTFLKVAMKRGLPPEQLRGVLPTQEEVQRVNDHLLLEFPQLKSGLVFVGVSDSTSLPSGSVDKCVCNGVFLLLPDEAKAIASFNEFARITRRGGVVLIGEVPDIDEATISNPLQSQHAPSSALNRAWRVLVGLGLREAIFRLKRRLMVTFDRRVHLISPPTTFWMLPSDFEEMGRSAGFVLIRKQRSPSLSLSGQPTENEYRWNYLFRRI
jgi:SAM-dependent methyltransferase